MPADISAEEWDAIPDIAMPDAEIGDAAAGEIQMDQPGDPDKA
jgi:hypothetical protein